MHWRTSWGTTSLTHENDAPMSRTTTPPSMKRRQRICMIAKTSSIIEADTSGASIAVVSMAHEPIIRRSVAPPVLARLPVGPGSNGIVVGRPLVALPRLKCRIILAKKERAIVAAKNLSAEQSCTTARGGDPVAWRAEWRSSNLRCHTNLIDLVA